MDIELCENCKKKIVDDELDEAIITEDGVWLCKECYNNLKEDHILHRGKG